MNKAPQIRESDIPIIAESVDLAFRGSTLQHVKLPPFLQDYIWNNSDEIALLLNGKLAVGEIVEEINLIIQRLLDPQINESDLTKVKNSAELALNGSSLDDVKLHKFTRQFILEKHSQILLMFASKLAPAEIVEEINTGIKMFKFFPTVSTK